MSRSSHVGPIRVVVALVSALTTVFAPMMASAFASGSASRDSTPHPCRDGGPSASASASRTHSSTARRCNSSTLTDSFHAAADGRGAVSVRRRRGGQ